MESWRLAPRPRRGAALTDRSMMNRRTLTIVLSLALAPGCGAAQLAMRSPISNQCSSTGLKGCPELTDGVMEYVGGDRTVAEGKLRAAAAANSPEQLRVFASALDPIGSTIGGDTGAALKGVAAILLDARADETPTAKASGASGASGSPRTTAATPPGQPSAQPHPPPPNVVIEELRAGTERVAANARVATCGGIFGSDPKCGRVRVFIGPLVVTNAYASGGCPDELFLSAGRIEKPHWILVNPPGAAMNVAGQFILEDGEELFAGVRATAAAPKDDVKCSITWSGFRPVSADATKWGRYLED